MPTFKFNGRDANGKPVDGERPADSADNLYQTLLDQGITPIHITIQNEQVGLIQRLKNFLAGKKVDNNELALFTRQMYTLIKAGVPITTSMKHLSQTSRSAHLAQVLLGLSQKLESGQNLALSMEQYPETFTPLVVAMVQIGQNTGQLDTTFLHLTQYLELEGSTMKRFKTAMRYPMFVMIAIVIGVIIIDVFVIPAFARVYAKSGIKLPWATIILINISSFIVTYWIYITILITIGSIALKKYLKTPEGKYKWHRYQLKIPIIGFLLQRMILLRFAEAFTIVVNSGIPINEGLPLVAQAIDNMYAREEIIGMKNAIQRGSSIFQAASACKLFTNLELQMLSISEQTGELGSMLNEIARYYQREVEYDLKNLTDIVEPLLLSGVSVIVLLLALAVYMPIWNMVKLVH